MLLTAALGAQLAPVPAVAGPEEAHEREHEAERREAERARAEAERERARALREAEREGAQALREAERERLQALEQARRELERAKQDLERAAREMAEQQRTEERVLRKQVETIKERERAYEFWMNPKRAMLGVVIGPGDDRGDRFVGTRILAVTPGSGAEKAGLKAGDLIVGVDGKRVEHLKSEPGSPEVALGKKMGVLEHEQKVALEYERDGKPGTVTVTAMRPEHFKDAGAYAMPKFFGPCDCADAPPPPLAPDAPRVFSMPGPDALRYSRDFRGLLGLELVSMNADLASYFKTREGLLVLHAPDDGTLGLRAGDVIRKIGGKAIDEPRDAMDRLSALDKGEEVAVEIVRKGQRMMLQGTLPKLGWHGKHESRDLRIVIDKKD